MDTFYLSMAAAVVITVVAIAAIHVVYSRHMKLVSLNDRLLWRLQEEFVKEGLNPHHASYDLLSRDGCKVIIPLGWKVDEPPEPGRLDLVTRIHAQCKTFAAENGAKLLFVSTRLEDNACLVVGVK